MSKDKELLGVVNGSGFPLQIAIQHAVEESGGFWKVRHKEHAWKNELDELSGFIDIVLQHSETKDSLVLECKRVQNASWLFLSHAGEFKKRLHCKLWVTIFDRDEEKYFGWADVTVPLETPEAQFCCLRGQSSNNKNTFLERVAGELISSTEAMAYEERHYRDNKDESCRLYINVIVTNAPLYFASFDMSNLNLNDGVLTEADFHRVPYLRVRKQFSLRPVELTYEDWSKREDIEYRRENTVFVVEAVHLVDFLKNLDVRDIDVRRIKA